MRSDESDAELHGEHSRPLLLASRASGRSQRTLFEHIAATRVRLSAQKGREDVLRTVAVTIDTLRRLPVGLTLTAGAFADAHGSMLCERARAVDPERGLAVAAGEPTDLHIHLGPGSVRADIVAMPERHGGHVGTAGCEFGETQAASGLGVMTTAALVCDEAFKTIACVNPERGGAHRRLSWCPVTLSDDPAAAPSLPHTSNVNLAIVGLGAIGTATTVILSMLELTGTAMLVDPERFAPENVGTYSLGGADETRLRPFKTDLAARALPAFRCLRHPIAVQALAQAIDAGEAPWPRLVLSGTDSAQARRATQRLWPERLIDGATGETTCGLHDVAATAPHACLQCLFPADTSGPSSVERLAAATGLPPALLHQGDRLLTDRHLDALSLTHRKLLKGQVGKPVCGLAEAIGLTSLPADGYRPSVPFVSQQAACLMVGRLLATMLGIAPPGTFVQYDALIGPHTRTQEDRLPNPDCFCQRRGDIVAAVRHARAANALG